MTVQPDPAAREVEERLERLRAFIQASLDLGRDRATIGNLMSARAEVDAATPLVAALRARAEAAERERDKFMGLYDAARGDVVILEARARERPEP